MAVENPLPPDTPDDKALEAQIRDLFVTSAQAPPPEPQPYIPPDSPAEAPAVPVAEPAEPAQPDAAAPEPEKPAEDPLEELNLRMEAERLRRERLEAELRLTRERADRQAGRAGYLQQQLARSQAAEPRTTTPAGESDDGEGGYEPEPAPVRAPAGTDPAILSQLRDLQAEAAARAYRDAVDEFSRTTPDWGEHRDAMMANIQRLESEYAEELGSGSPKVVRRAVTTILKAAHADARAAAIDARIAEKRELRAKQMAAMTETARTTAQPAPSGSPAAPSKPKTPNDMTDKEIADELNRLYRM